MFHALGSEPFEPPSLEGLPLSKSLALARREVLALMCGGIQEERDAALLALLDAGRFSDVEPEIQYYEQLLVYGRIARSPAQKYHPDLQLVHKALHGKLTERYRPRFWGVWILNQSEEIQEVNGYTCGQLPSYLWFMGEGRLVFRTKPDWSTCRDDLVRRLSPERRALAIEQSLAFARHEVRVLEQRLRDLRPEQKPAPASADSLSLLQHVRGS